MLESLELDRMPFLPDPSTESIFLSEQLKEAERRLLLAAKAKAIGLLTGDTGAGKTTVLRYVAGKLVNQGYRVLYSNESTGGAFNVLRSLHYALGSKPPRYKADLTQGFVEACTTAEESLLIIVDEVQLMSEDGLQQLRLLTNRDFDTRPPFALLLAGCPDVHDILGRTRLASLRKRILMSYNLQGLTEDEAKLYLEHHLHRAGARRKLLEPAAIRELFGHSRGNPRMLNQLALTALIAAVAAGRTTVGLDQVRQAVREVDSRP
jgi:type II secretory pathway predicted ATPase ExeA